MLFKVSAFLQWGYVHVCKRRRVFGVDGGVILFLAILSRARPCVDEIIYFKVLH